MVENEENFTEVFEVRNKNERLLKYFHQFISTKRISKNG